MDGVAVVKWPWGVGQHGILPAGLAQRRVFQRFVEATSSKNDMEDKLAMFENVVRNIAQGDANVTSCRLELGRKLVDHITSSLNAESCEVCWDDPGFDVCVTVRNYLEGKMDAVYDALACRRSVGVVKLSVRDITVSTHSMHKWGEWIGDNNPAHIVCQGTHLGPQGATQLACIVINDNILSLDVGRNDIQKVGCTALLDRLGHVRKNSDGTEEVELRCKRLSKFDIRHNQVGDEAFLLAAKLYPKIPLSCSGNDLSEAVTVPYTRDLIVPIMKGFSYDPVSYDSLSKETIERFCQTCHWAYSSRGDWIHYSHMKDGGVILGAWAVAAGRSKKSFQNRSVIHITSCSLNNQAALQIAPIILSNEQAPGLLVVNMRDNHISDPSVFVREFDNSNVLQLNIQENDFSAEAKVAMRKAWTSTGKHQDEHVSLRGLFV